MRRLTIPFWAVCAGVVVCISLPVTLLAACLLVLGGLLAAVAEAMERGPAVPEKETRP